MEISRNQYIQNLIENRHNHLIKIITGLRRVGKSYLLFKLYKQHLLAEGVPENHIIAFSLDNFAYREFRNPERLYNFVKEQIIDNDMYYIFLDEVQLLEDFVDVLNGFLYMENVDVYVTGSNARFLSSDIVTEFRGRGVQIHVSPLNFIEFKNIHKGDNQQAWQEYMLYGGLPMVAIAPTAKKKNEILHSLIKETYLTDIIARNQIRQDYKLEELFLFLASNIGSLSNPQKIADTMRSQKKVEISANTCQKYIQYFIDAFLIEQALRYDIRGRKYINTPLKYYFSDCGLRNALLQFRQIEPTHIMENIIYNELRVRGYNVDVGKIDTFTKDADGKTQRNSLEIDFICNRGYKRVYIQSAYSMPTDEKIKQEERSLTILDDSFQKIIITADNIPTHQNENGVYICNLYDFLLSEDLLN